MLDINIPEYVWIVGLAILFIREARYWIFAALEYDMRDQEFKHECELDAKDKDISDAVKHMFS